MEIKNYYEVLGCHPSANAEEIKKAYRELASKLHPDLASPRLKDWAERQMRQINEAYEVLGNAKRRAEYDRAWQGATFKTTDGRRATPANPSVLSNPLIRNMAITIGISLAIPFLFSKLAFILTKPSAMLEMAIIIGIVLVAWWMRRSNR